MLSTYALFVSYPSSIKVVKKAISCVQMVTDEQSKGHALNLGIVVARTERKPDRKMKLKPLSENEGVHCH